MSCGACTPPFVMQFAYAAQAISPVFVVVVAVCLFCTLRSLRVFTLWSYRNGRVVVEAEETLRLKRRWLASLSPRPRFCRRVCSTRHCDDTRRRSRLIPPTTHTSAPQISSEKTSKYPPTRVPLTNRALNNYTQTIHAHDLLLLQMLQVIDQ